MKRSNFKYLLLTFSLLLLLPLAIWIFLFSKHDSFLEAQNAFSEIFPWVANNTSDAFISGQQFDIILLLGLVIISILGAIQFDKNKTSILFKSIFILLNATGIICYTTMLM